MRMNISIPDDLRKRMDEVGGVNWSAIAQHAFEIEVNSRKIGDTNMDAVAARLRASKKKIEQDAKVSMIEVGKNWASNGAEYDQLQRVLTISPDRYDETESDRLAVDIVRAMSGEEDPSVDEMNEFLEMLYGDEGIPKRIPFQYFVWFLDGVKDVWERVEDLI